MKKRRKIISISLFLFFIAVLARSEERESSDVADLVNHKNVPVRIKTVQRGNFQGILREVNDDWVEIIDKNGQILFIDIASIESYVIFSSTVEKEAFFQDSASNRLIVMPTGFPMEKGEFHVANQELVIVTMSYGLNEHISFWSGISIPGIMFNARFTASFTPSFAVSFGSFAGFSWITEFAGGALIPYSIASWGEPNNNITLGGGPLIIIDPDEDKALNLSGVICVLGGKKVITSTTSLIFENWIIWGHRTNYLPMVPVPWSVEEPPDYAYEEHWSAIPVMIFPAICFRIAGPRFSWDIGVVVPLMIVNDEEIITDNGENGSHYWKNTKYRINGIFDEIIIPIPIFSVTYRID